MNNQPTQPKKELSDAEAFDAGINIYLREICDWLGSWDDLRKRIDYLEQQSKENAGERHFSRDL